MENLIKNPVALSPFQQKAYENFLRLGLPTTKQEEWRYTSLKKGLGTELAIAETGPLDKGQLDTILADLPAVDGRIVFLNGQYQADLSLLPKGVECSSTHRDDLNNDEALTSLRAAVQGEQKLSFTINSKEKLRLLCLTLSHQAGHTIQAPSVHFEVTSNSSLSLLHYNYDEANQDELATLGEMSLELGPNAQVTWLDLNHAQSARWSVQERKAVLAKDAQLYYTAVLLGGQLTRLNLQVIHTESGSHSTVDGLYALQGPEHSDIFSSIEHRAAHTTSSQLVKGLLSDHSRGVFTGRVHIHRDAQQVDASQLNKNLLLTPKAHVFTRPQLEVDADDVKCAHGATVGQLSNDELFYLESRGFPPREAQSMLSHAFVQEVLEKVPEPALAAWGSRYVEREFERKLGLVQDKENR